MKYFKILSPLQVTEDLKDLLNQVFEQFENKNEFVTDTEEAEETSYELALSVSQSSKIPLIAEMATLPVEIRQIILLVLLENRYFLKNYQFELIAAVIYSLTKENLPLPIESFIEHYDMSWNQAFPAAGKSKSVWLFHYDCRFWLLLLRIIVKSIEQESPDNIHYLCNIALDKVIKFKKKFKGYGHFPEVSPLVVILIRLGDEDIIKALKEYCHESLPKVHKQFEVIQGFTDQHDKLLTLLLQGYDNVPSEKWLERWREFVSNEDKHRIRKLCNDLWSCYLPTEEECKKLAHLSGGTLDMEVILGIQRQLYQDFQDMTEYEEFGRNITRSALWGLGFLDVHSVVDDLYAFCKKYCQFNEFCRAAIYALENIETSEALRVLQNIQRLVTNRDLKKAIYSALQKQGTRLGFSVEVLNDLTTDDCGLDINGIHSWILGRDFVVKLILNPDGTSAIEYVDKSTEKRDSNPPKLLRAKYEDEYNAIQEFHTLLIETLKMQAGRLEEAMCQQRSWDYTLWKDIFENNPINNNLAKRLLWSVYDKNHNLKARVLPLEKDKFLDLEASEVSFDDRCYLKISHPVLIEEGLVDKWHNIFEERKIVNAINQLKRKIFKPDDKEEATFTDSERYKGVKVPFDRFQNKMREHLWHGFGVSDFDESEMKYKDYHNLLWRSVLSLDLTGINIWRLSSEVMLKEISFYKLEKRGKHYKAKKSKSLISEVDLIVYSETMQDIHDSINTDS